MPPRQSGSRRSRRRGWGLRRDALAAALPANASPPRVRRTRLLLPALFSCSAGVASWFSFRSATAVGGRVGGDLRELGVDGVTRGRTVYADHGGLDLGERHAGVRGR